MPLGKKEKHSTVLLTLVLIFTLLLLGPKLLSTNWALARFVLCFYDSRVSVWFSGRDLFKKYLGKKSSVLTALSDLEGEGRARGT